LVDQGGEAPGHPARLPAHALHHNYYTFMDSALDKFILRLSQHCEFPNAEGRTTCTNPATHIILITGERWSYRAAVCEECRRYALDEQKTKW
jgi:hypothetical protein